MLSHASHRSATPNPSRRVGLSLFLLSAATLTFEINLTRLFSVAQFYHFGFLVVSIALLGFGASGTMLSLFPRLGQKYPQRSLGWLSLATGMSMLGAYILTNWLPFDSYSIAWERKQVWVLALHYIALALPFFFNGMAVSILLSAYPQTAGRTYAVNLVGSASGCAVALVVPPFLGGEGTVVFSSALAALAAAVSAGIAVDESGQIASKIARGSFRPFVFTLLLLSLFDLGLRIGGRPIQFLDLRISPYKSISYALQYPDAEIIYRRWNSFSRVDVVRSSGIRSVPALSYRYLRPPPQEDGLFVDGDDLSPVVYPDADLAFSDYLASAIAFRLRPNAQVLILEPRGGLDILAALASGARQITAVEVNPLIVEAASRIYQNPKVQVVNESDRSYVRRTQEKFDIVLLSLTTSYHPVRSGAYSLAEDYRYTVGSFQDVLTRLNPDGFLVVTRWLQTPPSEGLRTFALAVTALERLGLDPRTRIVALRSYNTGTFLVKKSPITSKELQEIREFAGDRAFDLAYAPGIHPEEVNRYNILSEPVYYQAYTGLLEADPRERFYAEYAFDVRPPTDDRPFFSHFFKWSQAGQVWAELGKTWQPFGGAGYFVILALLALASLLAGGLIFLPVVVARLRFSFMRPESPKPPRLSLAYLIYFGLIGFGYLMVEIPLIQRFILFLGHPAYALTGVLFTLLLFSGLGSRWSERIPLKHALVILVALLLSAPQVLPTLFSLTLGLPLAFRMGLTVVTLAPIGFLMGVPFPAGIKWLLAKHSRSSLIPWVWGVNGATSVVSAVLAALLALSFGFSWVLRLGSFFYAAAWLTVVVAGLKVPGLSPRR